jgi:hypothetical protein
MTQAQKQHLYGCGAIVCKLHIRIAKQVGMHLVDRLTRIAPTVYECKFNKRMAQQQTNELATGISGATNDACFEFRHVL